MKKYLVICLNCPNGYVKLTQAPEDFKEIHDEEFHHKTPNFLELQLEEEIYWRLKAVFDGSGKLKHLAVKELRLLYLPHKPEKRLLSLLV